MGRNDVTKEGGWLVLKEAFLYVLGDRWAQQVDSSWKLLVYRVQWVIFETSTSSQEKEK